jgi:thiol-disulfide isomerase/thioredoxin
LPILAAASDLLSLIYQWLMLFHFAVSLVAKSESGITSRFGPAAFFSAHTFCAHLPSRIVPSFSLPHNVLGIFHVMNKPFLATLAVMVGLSGLVIGNVAARANRIKAAWTPARVHAQGSAISRPTNSVAPSDGSKVIRFVRNPQPAPPFLLEDLDGNVISTAAWQGKVVLVNFWATWCPPCREEIPLLIELAEKYKNELLVIGISVDDDPPSEVRRFARMAGINYPIVMRSRELMAEYGGIPALPTSFLINKEGGVVQKHEGLFSPDLYETEIRALIGLQVDATVTTFEDTGQIFLTNAARATELPGVDFSGLTPEQKKVALKRMNTQICDCGCRLTIAQCRINDRACPVSGGLAERIVKEITATAPAMLRSPGSSQPSSNQ